MGAKLGKQKKDESESDTDTSINSGATIVRTKDRKKVYKTKKPKSFKPKISKIKTGKTKTGKLNANKLKSGSKDKKAKDYVKDEGKRKSKKSKKKKAKVNYIIKLNKKKAELVDWVKVNHPVVYKLLIKSDPNELWPLKRLLAFPVGLLISLAFYTMIVRRLQDSSNEYQQSLKLVMITFVTITYTFSTQMKVISWLIVPTFLGKTAKSVLIALLITSLVEGSIESICSNGTEAVRTSVCIFKQTVNETINKFKLLFKPYQQFMLFMSDLKDETVNLTEPFSKTYNYVDEMTNGEFSKINQEMRKKFNKTDEDEFDEAKETEEEKKQREKQDKKIGDAMIKKMINQCQNIIEKGKGLCEDRWYSATKQISNDLDDLAKEEEKTETEQDKQKTQNQLNQVKGKFNSTEAQQFKKQMCSMGSFGQAQNNLNKHCQDKVNQYIDPNIGKNFTDASTLIRKLSREKLMGKLKLKVNYPKELTNFVTPEEIMDTAKIYYQTQKSFFKWVVIILKKAIVLLFLMAFLQARTYHNKYIRNINFDNVYLSMYFRKIDHRRKIQGKPPILPLKRIERSDFIETLSFRLTPKEKSKATSSIVILIILGVIIASISYIDYMFYTILKLIKDKGFIQFKSTAYHANNSTVTKGNGSLAKFADKLIKSMVFEIDQGSKTWTNEECLPNPTQTQSNHYFNVIFTFIMIFIMKIIEVYILRLRHIICGYFYPKRDKKRILYLYNDRLKKRVGFLIYMADKVKKMVREKQLDGEADVKKAYEYDTFLPKNLINLLVGRMVKWKCIICDDKVKRKRFAHKCLNCGVVYCGHCWKELGKRCFGCNVKVNH